jgi:hypothetical protein
MVMPCPGVRSRQRDALVGLNVDEQDVRPQHVGGVELERRVRRTLELDRDRRLATRQALAGADVEGRVGPAPVVDVELRRHVRLRDGVGPDVLLLPVAGGLRTLDEPGPWPRTTSAGAGGRRAFVTFSFELRLR